MRLTADWQTRVSEATTGLNALGLDLSGLGRTGSDVQKVRKNATQVDSDEEPLVRFAATQEDAPVLCAGPSRQLSPGHGSLPESLLPTRHSAGFQELGPRGHRRGLVVEVASGDVDATAVDLLSAPDVISYFMKSDVPAVEEAATQVDSDDERMDNEILVTAT